ncbi:MAG: hypothetical protein EU551_04045 [Promethearchaeota archaeon]|nr:MAG: hypothetical protein EU551_04045 [Candidatus Lokiarchaeota archaeon]
MKNENKELEFIILLIIIIGIIIVPILYFIPSSISVSSSSFDKRVCAFYYTWYANQTSYYGENDGEADIISHWGESHPELDPPIVHDPESDPWDIAAENHPTVGTDNLVLYDSADPDAIRFHLDLAEYAGIDTFIATWWGQGNRMDNNFEQLLNITEMYDYPMQQTIYFETMQDKYSYENPNVVQNLYNDLTYVIDNYGNHSKFLKIYDKDLKLERPVIFVYSAVFKPSVENWESVIVMLHKNNYYPFLIADMAFKSINEEIFDIFDGFHMYNPLGVYRDEPDRALQRIETLVLASRVHNDLACATVLPGYNDTQVRHGVGSLERKNGETYKYTWEVAIQSNPDWILICSFNEWHEGTEIEPSYEHNTFYINKTKEYISMF